MHSHPNSRLTPLGRERLVRRHLDDGVPIKDLAAQAGISLRSKVKWLTRFRQGGAAALCTGRSIENSPHPAADARSAATAAGRGSEAPALHAPPHRQGSPGAPCHCRTCDERSGAGPAQESGAHEASAALPLGAPRRHDPCRHQTAGPLRMGWPPDHWRASSRLFTGCRLRKGARRNRRRHPPGLT